MRLISLMTGLVLVGCKPAAPPAKPVPRPDVISTLADDPGWNASITTRAQPPPKGNATTGSDTLVPEPARGTLAEDEDEDDGDDEGEGAEDPPIPKNCGVQRIRVKMGIDSATADVVVGTAKSATIDALATIEPPDKIGDRMPRSGKAERTVFALRNVHVFYAKREADHDYHLAIDDGTQHSEGKKHTMVIEAIDPTCLAKADGAPWIKYEQAARDTIDDAIKISAKGGKQDQIVSVVGVGFFDKIHGGKKGQKGHAPNGIELHPVLAICFGKDCKFGQ